MTLETQVINIKGEPVKTVKLPEDVFGLRLNGRCDAVLQQTVKAYLANKRQGTHATKTRSLVSGGGKKPFKQKGTGNARQGSSRSPLQRGGAVTHGPQPRDYRQKINKKVGKLALRYALSDRFFNGALIVVDDFAVSQYSTKGLHQNLLALKAPKALLADERKDDFLYRSGRNIKDVAVVGASDMNAEDVLRYEKIMLSENALASLVQRLGGENS